MDTGSFRSQFGFLLKPKKGQPKEFDYNLRACITISIFTA